MSSGPLPASSAISTPVAFFFDTNALVQGYLPNTPGTGWIRQVLNKRHGTLPVYISDLARVEFRSSLYKLERIFGTHSSFTDALVNQFDCDVRLSLNGGRQRLYTIVALSGDVIERARELLGAYRSGKPYGLRSLDALQLATALLTREALPVDEQLWMALVTSDRQLGGVARHAGFIVIRPEESTIRA